jgi:hypothetical protein
MMVDVPDGMAVPKFSRYEVVADVASHHWIEKTYIP